MNPYSEIRYGIFFILVGITLIIIDRIVVFKASRAGAKIPFRIVAGVIILSVIGGTILIRVVAPKVAYYIQFLDTKNKLDGASVELLSVIANKRHGLTFSLEDIKEPTLSTVRYLMSLQLIKTDIFPPCPEKNELGRTYYLTSLGRYLLEEELRVKVLYPEEFCHLRRIRWWEGCKETYPEESAAKEQEYERIYRIPYNKSAKMLTDQLKSKHPDADLDTYIDNHIKERDFEIAVEELAKPWQREVDKKRCSRLVQILVVGIYKLITFSAAIKLLIKDFLGWLEIEKFFYSYLLVLQTLLLLVLLFRSYRK